MLSGYGFHGRLYLPAMTRMVVTVREGNGALPVKEVMSLDEFGLWKERDLKFLEDGGGGKGKEGLTLRGD